MDIKILIISLILLSVIGSAYDVNRTYYLNESAGVIIDETVGSLQNNSIFGSTIPELLVVLFIFILVLLPIALLFIVGIYILKKFGGVK